MIYISHKPSILLFNSKHVTNQNKKSAVYKLTCSDCNMFYLVQTGWGFETRHIEQRKSSKLNNSDSISANPILESIINIQKFIWIQKLFLL